MATMITDDDIFAEGYLAFDEGVKFIELNPYIGGKSWILWRRGWQAARREHVRQWRENRTDSRSFNGRIA